MRLARYLDTHADRHGLGIVLPAPIAVLLDARTGVQPDLVFVRAERRAIIARRAIEGAPDLIVEVLSPSTAEYDRGLKLRRSAAAGVPHFWLVDVDERRLEALRLTETGDYAAEPPLGPGGSFRPDLFPGLAIPLDTLWL